MAPSMVLLKRTVDFSSDETESRGKSIHYPPWEARGHTQFPEERSEEILEYLQTFKAHAVVADPPEPSYLHILRGPQPAGLRRRCGELKSGHLSSADKNLVALCVGVSNSCAHNLPLGAYLIYDARNKSLSAIPQLPGDGEMYFAMDPQLAVVMCNGDDGSYVLAQLVRVIRSQVAVSLWDSSAPGWALKPARLHLPPGFCPHMCFSYRGYVLCWVDLLRGMVVYDLGKECNNSYNPEPQLRFIPLPQECPTYSTRLTRIGCRHPRPYANPEEFRSMSCVGNNIKFVCIDSIVEHVPGEVFNLTVYTLSSDLSAWTSRKYNVGNIWANEIYHSTGMPNLAPSFPVLSIHEDGVIYLVFTHLKVVDDSPECTGRCRVRCTNQYFLRVDMKNDNVQLYPHSTGSIIHSQLLASEISSYQQRLQDHPREMEASELGASGKRMIEL